VVEHLDNYRCDRCWHIIAAKYLSLKSEVDEVIMFYFVLIVTALKILWHPCFVIKFDFAMLSMTTSLITVTGKG
jgi:hypothetical protein